jgi:hypothetical protein
MAEKWPVTVFSERVRFRRCRSPPAFGGCKAGVATPAYRTDGWPRALGLEPGQTEVNLPLNLGKRTVNTVSFSSDLAEISP